MKPCVALMGYVPGRYVDAPRPVEPPPPPPTVDPATYERQRADAWSKQRW